MDGDSKRQSKKSSLRNDSSDAGDILQPTGVRCSIRLCNEIDGFLLDYGYNFLPSISLIIYCLLYFKEAL